MLNDDTHVFSDRVLADRRIAGEEFSHTTMITVDRGWMHADGRS